MQKENSKESNISLSHHTTRKKILQDKDYYL